MFFQVGEKVCIEVCKNPPALPKDPNDLLDSPIASLEPHIRPDSIITSLELINLTLPC